MIMTLTEKRIFMANIFRYIRNILIDVLIVGRSGTKICNSG